MTILFLGLHELSQHPLNPHYMKQYGEFPPLPVLFTILSFQNLLPVGPTDEWISMVYIYDFIHM